MEVKVRCRSIKGIMVVIFRWEVLVMVFVFFLFWEIFEIVGRVC